MPWGGWIPPGQRKKQPSPVSIGVPAGLLGISTLPGRVIIRNSLDLDSITARIVHPPAGQIAISGLVPVPLRGKFVLIPLGALGFTGRNPALSIVGTQTFNFYSSTTGNDSWNGLAPAFVSGTTGPFRTITRGIQALSAGQSLGVRGGVYPESISDSNIFTSGTPGARLRVANYNGENVILRPSAGTAVAVWIGSHNINYFDLDGINVDGTNCSDYTIKIDAPSHHWRVMNAEIIGPLNPNGSSGSTIVSYTDPSTIANPGGFNQYINLVVHGGGNVIDGSDHCFYIGTANNIVEYCDIYDSAGACVQLWNQYVADGLMSSANGQHDNIVRFNRMHDSRVGGAGSRGYGIIDGTGFSNIYYGNVIYAILNANFSQGVGIGIYSSNNCAGYNNTVANCAGAGIYNGQGGATGAILQNNISHNNTGGNYVPTGSPGGTVSFNSWQSPVNGANPLFNADFSLQEGSPCIDRGTTIAGIIAEAINHVTRPQGAAWDQGAYER